MKILPGVSREDFPTLLSLCGHTLGAEVGVQAGINAAHILEHWSGRLYLIDSWKQYNVGVYMDMANVSDHDHSIHYQQCLTNLKPYVERIQIIRKLSVQAANDIPDGSLDFVYLDANHAYDFVIEDLRAWYPKVRFGGMISGHDYTQDNIDPRAGCFGVKAAVNEFAKDKTNVLYVANEDWPNWHFFKE